MKTSYIKFKNEEIEIKDSVYYVDGTIIWEFDNNYGADALGLGGVEMDWIEDGNLNVMDENGIEVTNVERELVLDYIQDNWENYT